MTYQNIFIDGIMHLGDMIASASVIPVIREHCPNAKITYLAKDNLSFVAEMLEGIDVVMPYGYKSKGGYLDVYRIGRKLHNLNFDLGISLDPRERVTLMKWFAQIPERISMEQALGWKLGWEKYFYTRDLTFNGSWNVRKHRLAENFQLLIREFFHDSSTKLIAPKFKKSDAVDVQTANNLLAAIPKGRKRIGLCVETTGKIKDWRAEKFSELANELIEKYDAEIIMTGVPAHEAKIREISSAVLHKENILDVAGRTNFTQLIALLRQLDLMITLDTGTTHIAAASNCPVITIFTNNSPEIYTGASDSSYAVSAHLPCSGKYICIGSKKCPKTDCFDKITVDMVMDKVKKVLEN